MGKNGSVQPYFGVVSIERYRNKKLTKDAKVEVSDAGQKYIEDVLNTVRGKIGKTFIPTKF